MLITLDLENDVPIYGQLRNAVIDGIARGALKPGDALPSVRRLAEDLGINLHTVNKAYSILRAEGFVAVHKQKGVVVKNAAEAGLEPAAREALKEKLRIVAAELTCRGVSQDDFLQLCVEAFDAIHKGA